MSVPLSVLDLATVAVGVSPAVTVRDVLAAARVADAAGFHRFWVAEHHASARNAGPAPAVMVAAVAAATSRIRVGAGGVMLPNHAPFVVAEQFAVLAALHPDRVDLGVGRLTGNTRADPQLDGALRRSAGGTGEFSELVDELLGFLDPQGHSDRPFPAVVLSPRVDVPAEVFVLGASERGARLAAERSLPFVYGHHLGAGKARPAAAACYRAAFTPGPSRARPTLLASVFVVCAETDDRAEALALDSAREYVRAFSTTPPGEVRERHLAERHVATARVLSGSRRTVLDGIDLLADELGADEMMLVPYECSGRARARTLRHVGAAVGAEVSAAVPAPV